MIVDSLAATRPHPSTLQIVLLTVLCAASIVAVVIAASRQNDTW